MRVNVIVAAFLVVFLLEAATATYEVSERLAKKIFPRIKTDIVEIDKRLGAVESALEALLSGCSASSECNDDNSDCIGGYCRCKANYKYSIANMHCYKYFLGCYRDYSNRMLPSDHLISLSMTNEMCVTHCRSKGHKLAGLQHGKHCFCGNAIKSGYPKYGDSRCSMPCAGDAKQKCGNGWTNSIYATQ